MMVMESLSGKEIKLEIQTVSIPVDLVIDILKRLSARDVLRFRSVCKEWNFLLRTPRFISLHYNRSLQKRHENASFICLRTVSPRPSFLTSPPEPCPTDDDDDDDDPVSIALTFLTLEKTSTKLVAKVDKEQDLIAMLSSILFPYCPTGSDVCYLQMVCPFDGLICFGCGERVVMYNPATRESKVLPVEPEFSHVTHSCFDILGVWFESTMEPTYKVFRMIRGFKLAKIHIYDSTLDSWRVSKTVDGSVSFRSGLLLNGVVYFCMMRDSVPVVVTFDAKFETFGYFEMPQTFANGLQRESFLSFQGNLACMTKYIDVMDDTFKFDLWVMTDDGVQQSWTRKFRVPFDYSNYDELADGYYYYGCPIAFWKNKDEEDELLININGATMSFNLNTMKKINLKLPYMCSIIPYNVESLLSLK